MPRESSALQRVMTSLLSTPFQRMRSASVLLAVFLAFYYLPQERMQSAAMSMSACLSVHLHISKTTHPNFVKLFVTCGLFLLIFVII